MDEHYHPKYWNHHVIGPVQTNCYIIANDMSEAVIVDPGGPEAVRIVEELRAKEIEIKHVLVTHGHFDHLGWATEVQKATEGARVYLHSAERESYEEFQSWMPRLGFTNVELREPDIWVQEGDIIRASGLKFEVMHTPGHSPGSSTFIMDMDAYVGDCLFKGSIGRTDLPFSDPRQMEQSLHRLMSEIDPRSRVLPGHGEMTTMGTEILTNPFLRALKSGLSIF